MKSVSLVLGLSLCLAAPAFSVLSPYYQRQTELNRLLHANELYESVRGEPILQVLKTEYGYLVLTENHTQHIKVHYLPSNFIGPTPFELEFVHPEDGS